MFTPQNTYLVLLIVQACICFIIDLQSVTSASPK